MSGIKEEVRIQIEEWDGWESLPSSVEGFTLTVNKGMVDGMYRLFTYEDKSVHRAFFVVYHASLGEYHVQEEIGLNLFCQIDYITNDLAELKKMLLEGMTTSLQELRQFPQDKLGAIFEEKGIATWDYIPKLPQSVLGFDLFIHPNQSIRIINGSFLILDYTDFVSESNLALYYNIYRDEFFGELRILKMPKLITEFDTNEIGDLSKKMDEHFLPMLEAVRREIDAAVQEEQMQA